MRSALPWALSIFALACGTPPAPHGPGPASSSPGPVDAGAKPTTSAALNKDLPPMRETPAPGVRGSKLATRKREAAPCFSGAPVKANADAVLKGNLTSCKAKAQGPVLRGNVTDTEAHVEHRARVEAGRCYRVFVAAGADDTVVGVRDAAGDMVAESAKASVPEDGWFCFSSAGDIVITVAAGSGKGAYAVQLASD